MTSAASSEQQVRPTSDAYYSQYLQQGEVSPEAGEGQFAGAHGVGSKRKFREEKDDDKVSENVVGYQVIPAKQPCVTSSQACYRCQGMLD